MQTFCSIKFMNGSIFFEDHVYDWGRSGGGGGTLIFSCIRRLGSFFGLNFLNFNHFFSILKNEYFFFFLGGGGGGGLRKMNIFGG